MTLDSENYLNIFITIHADVHTCLGMKCLIIHFMGSISKHCFVRAMSPQKPMVTWVDLRYMSYQSISIFSIV